jgi:hypothetical protein
MGAPGPKFTDPRPNAPIVRVAAARTNRGIEPSQASVVRQQPVTCRFHFHWCTHCPLRSNQGLKRSTTWNLASSRLAVKGSLLCETSNPFDLVAFEDVGNGSRVFNDSKNDPIALPQSRPSRFMAQLGA